MAYARLARRVLATEAPVVVQQQSRQLDIQCHLKALGFRGLKVASKLQEVVLTKDLDRVGKAGDIVKVTKGYARNKLIPEMLALPKLEKYVRLVKEQVEALRSTQPQQEEVEELQESKTEEQKLKEISAVLIRLDTQRVVLRRHVGEEGKLRQPVTQQDLITEVRRQLKVQVQEVNLDMELDLSTLGEYEIPIRLPRNIELPGGKAKLLLKVRIRRK